MMSWNKVAVCGITTTFSEQDRTQGDQTRFRFIAESSEVVSAQSKRIRWPIGTRSEIDMISPMRIRSFVVVKVVSRNRRTFLTSTPELLLPHSCYTGCERIVLRRIITTNDDLSSESTRDAKKSFTNVSSSERSFASFAKTIVPRIKPGGISVQRNQFRGNVCTGISHALRARAANGELIASASASFAIDKLHLTLNVIAERISSTLRDKDGDGFQPSHLRQHGHRR